MTEVGEQPPLLAGGEGIADLADQPFQPAADLGRNIKTAPGIQPAVRDLQTGYNTCSG